MWAVDHAMSSLWQLAQNYVINKVQISGQKPRGRQLNAKVCGHESAIFRILLLVKTTMFNTFSFSSWQMLSHAWNHCLTVNAVSSSGVVVTLEFFLG